jgi:hypothetical protein
LHTRADTGKGRQALLSVHAKFIASPENSSHIGTIILFDIITTTDIALFVPFACAQPVVPLAYNSIDAIVSAWVATVTSARDTSAE